MQKPMLQNAVLSLLKLCMPAQSNLMTQAGELLLRNMSGGAGGQVADELATAPPTAPAVVGGNSESPFVLLERALGNKWPEFFDEVVESGTKYLQAKLPGLLFLSQIAKKLMAINLKNKTKISTLSCEHQEKNGDALPLRPPPAFRRVLIFV